MGRNRKRYSLVCLIHKISIVDPLSVGLRETTEIRGNKTRCGPCLLWVSMPVGVINQINYIRNIKPQVLRSTMKESKDNSTQHFTNNGNSIIQWLWRVFITLQNSFWDLRRGLCHCLSLFLWRMCGWIAVKVQGGEIM